MVRLTVMQGCRRKADFEVQLDQLLQHSTVGLIPAQGFQIRISSTFMLSPEFHLPRDIVHDIPDVPVISFMKVIEREFIQSFQLCCQLCRRNTTTLKQRHHAQRVVLAPTVRLVLSAQLLPAHGHGALVSLHRPPARHAVHMQAVVERQISSNHPTHGASRLSVEVWLHGCCLCCAAVQPLRLPLPLWLLSLSQPLARAHLPPLAGLLHAGHHQMHQPQLERVVVQVLQQVGGLVVQRVLQALGHMGQLLVPVHRRIGATRL
mmetsp:Transcript_8440/g.18536  ORF Transcript_8440/g.18536 Transcript_8440/m.18536 type:complete len:262 (-) Transcript_8440:1974-2759(-)